ncbi:MAG: zf-HC2 domain-containing protein, partial [Rubrivivax sp.]
MSSHEELRVSLGSFVLGNLDLEEHRGVEAHLRTCQACRAELALLQPLTGLLDLARTTAVDQVQASSLLEQRVLEDHRRASEAAAGSSPSGSVARRRRSRWRLGRRWSMPAAG